MVIGIIGGIGTGKSTVLNILKNNYDVYAINADQIGHGLLMEGSIAFKELIDCFGNDILDESNNINRRKLSDIVFNDHAKRQQLNDIMHPKMKLLLQEIINKQSNQYAYIVLEAAILVEAGWADITDIIILVTCHIEERINRLISSRDITKEKAEKIIRIQASIDELKQYADYVIDNSYDQNNTKRQLKEIFKGDR